MLIDTRPLAIFLMGPTASGKTALACDLHQRFPVELISVDSALVYRGMDIGTAKPDAATLARHPHALVDIRDPAQAYSAADFVHDASDCMQQVSARGRIPLLVGGTGLYFRALEHGLSAMPAANPAVRASLAAEARRVGWPAMHAQLTQSDPASASRIDRNDAQRLQRALEVIALTGRSMSELHAQQRNAPLPWRVLKLAVLPFTRARLHERIAQRFDAMLAHGFVEEVRALHARTDLHADLPAMRAVGYRQAWQHLEGASDLPQFRELGIFATRQLAKRQITWLRSDPSLRLFDAERPDILSDVLAAVQLFLSGPLQVVATGDDTV